jgi:hypothetical protein
MGAVSGLLIFLCGPPGSAIRPMSLPLIAIGLEIASMVVVLPQAATAIFRERQWSRGLLAAFLALTPGVLCAALAILIVGTFGYRLLP